MVWSKVWVTLNRGLWFSTAACKLLLDPELEFGAHVPGGTHGCLSGDVAGSSAPVPPSTRRRGLGMVLLLCQDEVQTVAPLPG